MTPRPLPWMKPGDLILFDLELLPWPAYLRMVEAFFQVRGRNLRCLRAYDNRAEFLLTDGDRGEPVAALYCVQARNRVDDGELRRLQDLMTEFQLEQGYLFSPQAISSDVYLRAGDVNVELYSGNKLRVRVESLRPDLRRQVMDAISASPQVSQSQTP